MIEPLTNERLWDIEQGGPAHDGILCAMPVACSGREKHHEHHR